MHGFKAVARIGQRAPDDNRHRVTRVGNAHFVFDAHLDDLPRECGLFGLKFGSAGRPVRAIVTEGAIGAIRILI